MPFESKKQREGFFGTHPNDAPQVRRAPLGKLARHKVEDERPFQRMAESITTDLVDFLPDEIADLGVVSMDAWNDVAPDAASAALADLPDEGEFGGDGDAYFQAHEAQLKVAVIKALQKKGVRVVPTRRDALRLLADEGELHQDHLAAFRDSIVEDDLDSDGPVPEVSDGQEVYSLRPDGTVIPGQSPGMTQFRVKAPAKSDGATGGGEA